MTTEEATTEDATPEEVTREVMPESYAQKVGERLRAVRKQKHLSLQSVEAGSHQEFKASVLGAYERGERAISVPRLQRLARFYNVPVDQLLPRDAGPDWGGAGGRPVTIDLREEQAGERRGGSEPAVTFDLHALDEASGPECELLNRYLRNIQVQRQDFNGRMITIRRDDVRTLAWLLDTTPDALRRRIDDLGLRLTV